MEEHRHFAADVRGIELQLVLLGEDDDWNQRKE
jgi:hypothetical protein